MHMYYKKQVIAYTQENIIQKTNIKEMWCDLKKGTQTQHQQFAFEAKYTTFSEM